MFERKRADFDKLRAFVKSHRPGYVAIAAAGLIARDFRAELVDALQDLFSQFETQVAFVDPEVSSSG